MPGRLVPKHGRHAIAQATFAAEWEQPLDDTIFRQILDSHTAIAAELPRKQVGRGIHISIGRTGATPTTHPSAISNLTFDRVEPDGESAWVVMINPNHVSVACAGRHYTRWSETSVRALNYLKFILRTVVPGRPISIVALQYVDEFLWEGEDKDEFTADKLFRRGRYLAPVVFETVGLWHCHSGFYLSADDPVRHRTLNNINVNVINTPDAVRAAQVTMAHRVLLSERLAEYSDDLFVEHGLVTMLLRRLHDLDKGVLRDLLVPAMAQQISLDDRE
jgi:uncharacterized protein (TIGR04255 family)